MTNARALDRGREAFARRAWGQAHAQLSAADRAATLGCEDLEALATAAYLSGDDEDSASAWERAHHALLARADVARAVRCAFWLGLTLVLRGSHARGGGWLARAGRLLDEAALDCVERGYLLLPGALQALEQGDAATAYSAFGQVAKIADRFDDPDLAALSLLGRGQSLIRMGEAPEGATLLDEAMVGITSGRGSPIVAGIVYCAVILACREIFDVRRAQEWTAALSAWCAAQPELVPFRGQCLVHRSEILQLRGRWADAMQEAQRACDHLSRQSGNPVIGMALYQQAELHRLRGRFGEAAQGYREATRHGRGPHPGLALLRLAQGDLDAARTAARRVLEGEDDRVTRAGMLAASVDIMLACQDAEAVRAGAEELSVLAGHMGAPYLDAVAAYARAAALLCEGDLPAAHAAARRACVLWQELQTPYEAARARVLMGLACRQLGDEDTAEMELDAARWTFQRLGAEPDVVRVDALRPHEASQASAGLTRREAQILRLVASGRTNRAIAAELVISEKTVARHVSNMFVKLGVSSRSAATAYAYEQHLV